MICDFLYDVCKFFTFRSRLFTFFIIFGDKNYTYSSFELVHHYFYICKRQYRKQIKYETIQITKIYYPVTQFVVEVK